MAWPTDWDERVAGTVYSLCAEGRPDDTKYGRRIAVGELSDAYLARRGLVCGYAIVVWRGRHLVEPTDLSAAEAAIYNAEVLQVGRAIQLHCRPMKMNYQTLGNWSPHLHTHVTARYRDDVAPGKPLPAGPNVDRPEAEWLADVAALKSLLAASP
ncbi:MAG TPA: HIT domain-containing protein [Mycobacteriales bacterium]|jgi:diadenosine tetraphosphate (Ap4A) HIT family hydrolase|nr:HIT domain-containing protein [Mycobacteriales bacterium]